MICTAEACQLLSFEKLTLIDKSQLCKFKDWYLKESHAILRYLARAYDAPNHWYYHKDDSIESLQIRSKIDEYLDWHHTNLRQGIYGQIKKTLIQPMFGREFDESEIEPLK